MFSAITGVGMSGFERPKLVVMPSPFIFVDSIAKSPPPGHTPLRFMSFMMCAGIGPKCST